MRKEAVIKQRKQVRQKRQTLRRKAQSVLNNPPNANGGRRDINHNNDQYPALNDFVRFLGEGFMYASSMMAPGDSNLKHHLEQYFNNKNDRNSETRDASGRQLARWGGDMLGMALGPTNQIPSKMAGLASDLFSQ